MAEPLVSVMIPTYRQESYVTAAVQSALDQTYKNMEIVIVDDCSPDGTASALKELVKDRRVSYFRAEHNRGRVATYRHALYELAHGTYVTNLDGDDTLGDPRTIEIAVRAMEEDAAISLVYGKIIRFSGQHPGFDVSGGTLAVQTFDGTDRFLRYWDRRNTINHLGTVYRKSVAVDFYRRNIISSDLESLLRIMPGFRIARLDTISGFWRAHGSNASVAPELTDAVNNLSMVESVANDRFVMERVSPHNLRRWRKRMLHARIYGSATTHYIRKGRFRDAVRFVAIALRRYPEAFFRVVLDPRLWVYLTLGTAIFRLRKAQ